jgi:hypothetical protein
MFVIDFKSALTDFIHLYISYTSHRSNLFSRVDMVVMMSCDYCAFTLRVHVSALIESINANTCLQAARLHT